MNISIWWNFGSLLGLVLSVQLLTGFLLSIHYSANVVTAFASVDHILRDVNGGWMLRMTHANGASFFFLCLYAHVGRGLYYGSYHYIGTWIRGVMLLLLVMASAFLGYVLPWGQMRFWGATVITNLFSAFPYGDSFVQWLWGGFSVDNATLSRFYSFHFLIPLLVAAVVILHLMLLHATGRNNPIGLSSDADKVPFHVYFTIKDIVGFMILLFFLGSVVLFSPWYLGEPDNFVIANSLITPAHIVPEWYFLFAYAILRSLPRKLGGVVGLLLSVSLLFVMPFLTRGLKSSMYFPIHKLLYCCFLIRFLMLTFLGSCPVDSPFVSLSRFFSLMYFSFFILSRPSRTISMYT